MRSAGLQGEQLLGGEPVALLEHRAHGLQAMQAVLQQGDARLDGAADHLGEAVGARQQPRSCRCARPRRRRVPARRRRNRARRGRCRRRARRERGRDRRGWRGGRLSWAAKVGQRTGRGCHSCHKCRDGWQHRQGRMARATGQKGQARQVPLGRRGGRGLVRQARRGRRRRQLLAAADLDANRVGRSSCLHTARPRGGPGARQRPAGPRRRTDGCLPVPAGPRETAIRRHLARTVRLPDLSGCRACACFPTPRFQGVP